MNIGYIGSKLKLLNFIEETIDKVIPKDFKRERIVFADLFAGTGVVGNKFREKNILLFQMIFSIIVIFWIKI